MFETLCHVTFNKDGEDGILSISTAHILFCAPSAEKCQWLSSIYQIRIKFPINLLMSDEQALHSIVSRKQNYIHHVHGEFQRMLDFHKVD
jgi:hypothetical protein